jgi:nucleoside-diphosphate-sugar epimerase
VTSQARNRVYNIGNSQEVFTLAEAAQKVIDVLAPKSALKVELVGFDKADRNEQREIFTRYCDTSRAASELGYRPAISLEEGIRRIAVAGAIHESWTGFAAV